MVKNDKVHKMLTAVRGAVTLCDYPLAKGKKMPVDWDSFTMLSERGKDADAYMKEMRENDRL